MLFKDCGCSFFRNSLCIVKLLHLVSSWTLSSCFSRLLDTIPTFLFSYQLSLPSQGTISQSVQYKTPFSTLGEESQYSYRGHRGETLQSQRRLNGYDSTTGSFTPLPCSIVFQDFVTQTLLCLYVFPLEKAVQDQQVMQLGYLSVCCAFIFYQLGECWSKCLVRFHQFYHCYFFYI